VQVAVSGAQSEPTRSSTYDIRHGGGHTCALTSVGRLFCWGANYDAQLGLSDANVTRMATPQEIAPGTRWASVSAGLAHTCGIRAVDDAEAPGGLFCWGAAANGRLGHGPGAPPADQPRRVGIDADWLHVAAGGGHTCGVRGAGELYCWGAAAFGQLGLGRVQETIFTPERVGTDTDWTFVVAGLTHTCGLQGDGRLSCWGAAQLGQTGLTDGTGPCPISDDENTACDLVPRPILPERTWQSVGVGDGHTCARDVNRKAVCFGANYQGQLGRAAACVDGEGVARSCDWTDQPVELVGEVDFVAAGGSTTCRRSGDRLICTGEGRYGQRGNGSPDIEDVLDDPYPVLSPPRGRWDTVAVGTDHTCALTTLGELACFGSTADGQIGAGVFSAELRPVAVPLPGEIRDFSVGTSGAACAVVAPVGEPLGGLGDLFCWGDATTGLLLDRSTSHVDTPMQLTRAARFTHVAVGQGFACATGVPAPPLDDAFVVCWGRADRGQLGDAREHVPALTPQDVPGDMVERGSGTTVAVDSAGGCEFEPGVAGTARCWGGNLEGRLGPDSTELGPLGPTPLTVQLGVGATFDDVAVGDTRTFAIDSDRRLLGWGGMRDFWNRRDAGTSETREPLLRPVVLDPATDWLQIDARGDLLCGLRGPIDVPDPRSVTCGSLPAEAGGPAAPLPEQWVTLASGRWRSVAVGPQVVCATDADGRVHCGGDNESGLLGNGYRENEYLPRTSNVEAGNLAFAGKLSIGDRTACGIASVPDGPPGLYCWGHGTRGQLGTGVSDATVPVFVPIPAL
jgi:alpha-tubulin suppressor-like RCC1 family protein